MNEYTDYISSIEDVIEDARNGRMFILVDAEDRENEGDLINSGPDGNAAGDQLHGEVRPRTHLSGAETESGPRS